MSTTFFDYYDGPVSQEQRAAAVAWFERELDAGRLRTHIVKDSNGVEHTFFYAVDASDEERAICKALGLNISEYRGHLERTARLGRTH